MNVKLVFMNVKMTTILQSMDAFEKFKVIVQGVANIEFEKFDEEDRAYWVKKSEGEPYKLVGVSCETLEWFDPTVKVVSNGDKWIIVEQYQELLRHGSNWPEGCVV